MPPPSYDHPHAFVPNGSSEGSASTTESVRPCLLQAFPLPRDPGDARFQLVLEALAGSRSAPGRSRFE